MSLLTINEAWDKGVLAETSKLILPVPKRKITLAWEQTGADKKTLSSKGISNCHCISTGEMENGMLKIIGEVMPIILKLEGEVGARRGPTTLHYACSMLFDLPQGISARHITLADWRKYKKGLNLTAARWHWLATNHCKNVGNFGELGLFFASDDYEYGSTLYLTNDTIHDGSGAVRPVYYLPVNNPNIKIEVPEESEELRLVL